MHIVEVKECPRQVLFAVLFITQPGKKNNLMVGNVKLKKKGE